MTELYLLGPAEIRSEKGELEQSFLAGPKRLALLAYLLLVRPRGFHRRDSLLPFFWPYHDQKSARNALSNMLYHIRKTLGKEAVENRGSEEIRLKPEVFWSDVLSFEEALEDKEYERGLELYRNELLKGFHVQDISPDFDQWLEQERKRFHELALKANNKLSEIAAGKKDYLKAITWTKKASEWAPFSESIHLRLMELLYESGDNKAALTVGKTFIERTQNEFDEDPGPAVKALHEKIKKEKPDIPSLAGSPVIPSPNTSPNTSPLPTIAVLPFETLGMEKASAFTDAIHGDVLTRLSQVSDLFVISRTSVQSFRGTKKLLTKIGRELQVKWLLTGEVQEIGNRVKVSVRLVLASEDRQIWAENFQKQLTADNVFNIQAEITRNIIYALEMRLSSNEKKAIKQVPTEDLVAFRLQAHGRWNLDKRTEEGMHLAEEFFRRSIAQDPKYAQAWLGLADTLSLLHDYGYEKDERGILAEAEEAARIALNLDPLLAEAYASLGLLYTTKRKPKAAIFNLKKAVELRPGYAEAHAWLCWILQLTGHAGEGLQSAKKAVTMNPLSQEAVSNLSLSWLTNRDYEASLLEARRLLELQPDFATAQLQEGLALYHLAEFNEAKSRLRDIEVPWAGNGPIVTRLLSCINSGDDESAEELLEKIKDDQFALGLIESEKGNLEEALRIFTNISDWNYWEILSIYHLYPHLLDPIRQDPRFMQILQKVNINWGLDPDHLPKLYSPQTDAGTAKNVLKNSIDYDSRSAKSLAILPFKDLCSREPGITEGIHGDILVALSGVNDLQVISRSSACRYDRSGKNPLEIGAELHVNWLLEGEVKQDSNILKISLNLLRAQANSVVWSHSYSRNLTAENIFLLREEITKDILEVLEVKLKEDDQRIVPSPTADLQAYRLYVQGRNCLDQRTETGIYRGLDSFQGAIEADPDYALAWSGLADALSLFHYYGFAIPKNSSDPVDAAMQAVQIDPYLSEAHLALGIAYAMKQEGPAALKELERSVDLSPGHAEALIWLGWINLIIGKPEDGLAPAIQAVRLNPLTPAVRVFLAEIYLSNGLYEEALAEARRGREINPDYALAHYIEGLVLYHNRKFNEAANSFEQALSKIHGRGTPSLAEVNTALAFTQYALGKKDQGLKLKEEIYGRIDPFPLGMIQALYGEIDEAFLTFSRVQDWSSFATETIRYFFPEALSVIRKDERYKDLVKQVNKAWNLSEKAQ